jgi:hypothetical protein
MSEHRESLPEIIFRESMPDGIPNGIRTRAATLKGWCPRPLDDGDLRSEELSV